MIEVAPMHGSLVFDENELFADDDEEGDGVVGKELLTETMPESTEFLSLPGTNSSGVSNEPLLGFIDEDDNIMCIWPTLFDLGFGDGGIELMGANLIPLADEVLLLPLPVLLFPLVVRRFRWSWL